MYRFMWFKDGKQRALTLSYDDGVYQDKRIVEIPTSQVAEEVLKDRTKFEEMFEKRIVGGAYPFGDISITDDVVETLRLCGIKYCRATDPTLSFGIPKDWLRLAPTCHHKHPRLMELLDEFLNGGYFKRAKLFYLWGHSYEFDNDNNWEVIENFAKAVSGNEDVWFATNIEIYEYIEAYKRLEYFADGNTVYNPTLIDVWMYNDGTVYKIPAGEIVRLI